jgi:DNA-binding NarL/FixJ family response regulator
VVRGAKDYESRQAIKRKGGNRHRTHYSDGKSWYPGGGRSSHRAGRAGAGVIDQTADLSVCGQAENIPQALELIEKSKPCLVLVDISLGGQNGIELIKAIKVRHPGLLMWVHSMYDESMYAERCLRAGAKGYVMKQKPPPRLLAAIRQVLKGEVYLSDVMTKQMLSRISDGHTSKGNSPAELLSDRELEVFELVGRGYRTKEIAQQLHLSDKTVQTHREHIKQKLDLQDAVSLVRHAMQWTEARR